MALLGAVINFKLILVNKQNIYHTCECSLFYFSFFWIWGNSMTVTDFIIINWKIKKVNIYSVEWMTSAPFLLCLSYIIDLLDLKKWCKMQEWRHRNINASHVACGKKAILLNFFTLLGFEQAMKNVNETFSFLH